MCVADILLRQRRLRMMPEIADDILRFWPLFARPFVLSPLATTVPFLPSETPTR